MTDGVLVVDKPAGMTSHDVVDEVRRRLHERRVGHAGTLDPDATGILILGIGKATRFLSYAQASHKRYLAVARFGTTTTTQDAAGEVLEDKPAGVTHEDVENALPAFTGSLQQIPPMVSAVKVGGERLYKKARRGENVERPPRAIEVESLVLLDFTPGERPEATLDIVCSGGTYVRTLIHDLGQSLGCGAHMASLRRTEAGGFTEADAVALESVAGETVLPMGEVVRELDRLEISEDDAVRVGHGRPLDQTDGPVRAPVAVMRDGRLLAVYRPEGDMLVADRVVPE